MDLYPPESQKMDVIRHLEELRRRILVSLAVLLAATSLCLFKTDLLIRLAKRPLTNTFSQLIYISPTEAFIAYFKTALLAGFIMSFPVILYQAWAFLAPAFSKDLRKNIFIWLSLALVLFAGGILFSYWVLLPAALKYLLGFARDIAIPSLTLGKYISFFTAVLLIGAVTFEIPVAMGLLADLGILRSALLVKKRQYAFLGILIFAAIVTPTQDIFNMLLFALPMAVLFEAGIWIAKIIEWRKAQRAELLPIEMRES
jgi:sec-independent protein translocase protein TatC